MKKRGYRAYLPSLLLFAAGCFFIFLGSLSSCAWAATPGDSGIPRCTTILPLFGEILWMFALASALVVYVRTGS